MGVEENKELVRRLVRDVVARRDASSLEEIAEPRFAAVARRWVSPFGSAFPDFEMEIVDLIAEGDKIVAHFRCSGSHRGEWLGDAPTGRRFEAVDEIYVSRCAKAGSAPPWRSRTTSRGCASWGSRRDRSSGS